ncbi:MAG: acyl carrier protein [Clostridia bacterium]|nr:acyl carrier protein [Clostridia bacterium]
MERQEIKAKLKEILSLTDADSGLLEGELDEGLRLREDCGFSSVGMLYTVIGIEEMFGIRFDSVGLGSFVTVGDVVDFIGEKTK